MKGYFKSIPPILLGMLICALGLLLIGSLSQCSPKVTLPSIQIPEITTRPDTVILTSTITKTDTLELAGYVVEVHDTIDCPAGLERDTTYYVTFNHYLPGKTIITQKTVHDTVRLVSALPAPGLLPAAGAGWGERLTWLGGVLLLVAALWRKWKGEQARKATA